MTCEQGDLIPIEGLQGDLEQTQFMLDNSSFMRETSMVSSGSKDLNDSMVIGSSKDGRSLRIDAH